MWMDGDLVTMLPSPNQQCGGGGSVFLETEILILLGLVLRTRLMQA